MPRQWRNSGGGREAGDESIAGVIATRRKTVGYGQAKRCAGCRRYYIPRTEESTTCRLCLDRTDQKRHVYDGVAYRLVRAGRWRPVNDYTATYLKATGYEIAVCGGCGAARYKPVGANCERCATTCGLLWATG